LGCDAQREKCISISEKEFENLITAVGDKAILRQQLKACQDAK
jgi:hypothetical protein